MKKLSLLLIFFFIVAGNLFAQENRGFIKVRIETKDHIALVIGNSNYPDMPLENPKNDANAVGSAFEDMGFIVEKIIDADKEQMSMAIDRFSRKMRTARVAVFYFAGHGMQVDGENYLIPIGRTAGTQINSEKQVAYRAINASEVLIAMETNKVKFSLIVLDACRNNPIKGSGRGKLKGLASIDAPAGSLVMYATKAGDVASDGVGENSPFTTAFLQHITTPGLDVNLLPSRVTQTVRELTNNSQTPGSYVQITQSFTFVPEYTTAELEQIRQQQKGKLSKLQQKEAEIQRQKDKEDAEMLRKQAEIKVLEKQIADMKNNTDGETDLDKMLEIIEQKEKQKAELDVMKKKAEAEKKIREKEMKQIKQQKFDENIAKYNKIANSEYGQDMKETAWNSVLKNLGIAKGSIDVGEINTLKIKYYDLPSFVDKRDGRRYIITIIGSQVWMAENLAYKARSGCWVYDNDQSNVSKYGYLYNYQTARNVCPSGYHLPSKAEYETLLDNYRKSNDSEVNYTALMQSGPNGFSAVLGGAIKSSTFGKGHLAYFWSTTPSNHNRLWCLQVYSIDKVASTYPYGVKSNGFSVRCVQD